nr:phosphodiester glycosidase family protein [Desulfuribacillus stibiiarsenatis]
MYIRIQLFAILLLAPFVGLLVGFIHQDTQHVFSLGELKIGQSVPVDVLLDNKQNFDSFKDLTSDSIVAANVTKEILLNMRNNAQAEIKEYDEQRAVVEVLVETSKKENKNTSGVLDQILARILGDPIGQTFGKNATIKVYSLEEAGYRGYMAKVRLLNPDAIQMVLANNQIASKGETTSQAAKRNNALLAINAGGFSAKDGNIVPLGITVINGEVLTFSQSDLSFVGFNQSGNLVGGKISSKEKIQEMGILHGASFLPTLLKNGEKQPIPKEWANARHPRTLIGHFQNGDLLFIVIDGRRQGWSDGVTLEEAQTKLLEFNVRDAYNLDGGGSSTFYYDGKVLNKPSGGSERRVTTNIVIKP